jgi:hypothetical protein
MGDDGLVVLIPATFSVGIGMCARLAKAERIRREACQYMGDR